MNFIIIDINDEDVLTLSFIENYPLLTFPRLNWDSCVIYIAQFPAAENSFPRGFIASVLFSRWRLSIVRQIFVVLAPNF